MGKILGVVFISILIILVSHRVKAHADVRPPQGNVEIESLDVISTVQARFATTLIASQVANRGSSPREVSFTAQLPDAAFISNFSMRIDERTIYGNVKEKAQARADFDAAKARGESTGLVAKKPRETNAFTITVNVAALSTVQFNLTYQEVLKRVHGVYKQVINLQPDQPVSEMKVDVYITERGEITNIKIPKFGERIGEKPNKELSRLSDDPDVLVKPILKENGVSSVHIRYRPHLTRQAIHKGQLAVLYDVKRDKSAGDIQVVNGYFVHFFAPDGYQKRPKNIVFVLDKSGSMEGRKMSQMKEAMKVILNDLSPEDTFRIIFFSDATETWQKEFSKASAGNVKNAIDYVDKMLADGMTNIYDSLQEAIRALKSLPRSNNVPMILFLTDGQPTVGEVSLGVIIEDTTKANDQERKIIIHSVAFGEDADYTLLQKISARNRGLARRVYEDSDSSIQLAGFYEEISSPILTNLKIDYLNETVDASSVVQDTTQNYYDGSEVVVVGKLRDDKKNSASAFSAKVSGQGANGDVGVVSRSSPMIVCRDPWPYLIYDVDAAEERPVAIGGYPRPPIWCCPPPYCCYWRRCPPPPPPPPTPGPKEPLPASSVGGFVERMWAYQTIKKLLRDTDLKDDSSERGRAKQKALDLSLKYHFVTDLTSMVVVQPDEPRPIQLIEDKFIGGSSAAGTNGAAAGGGQLGPRRPTSITAEKGGGLAGAGGGIPPPVAASGPGGKKEEGTDDRDKTEQQRPSRPTSGQKPSGPPPGQKPGGSSGQKPSGPSSGCTSQIVFIRDSSTVASDIDSRRSDYAKSALNQIDSNDNIDARVAVLEASSSGQATVVHSMDFIPSVFDSFKSRSGSGQKSSLVQAINSQFGQYAASNVKRRVVFLITSKSVQYAVDASSQLRSHGVVVHVVSFVDDKTSGFQKTLSSITTSGGKVFSAPSSNGKELGQALSQC